MANDHQGTTDNNGSLLANLLHEKICDTNHPNNQIQMLESKFLEYGDTLKMTHLGLIKQVADVINGGSIPEEKGRAILKAAEQYIDNHPEMQKILEVPTKKNEAIFRQKAEALIDAKALEFEGLEGELKKNPTLLEAAAKLPKDLSELGSLPVHQFCEAPKKSEKKL